MTGNTKPDLVIAGTGAMACLFASRLVAVGIHPVLLGSWEAGVKAINEFGIKVVGAEGTVVYPARATTQPCDCGEVDFALVLVKSWQTERAGHQLAECLSTQGIALSLQNGDGNYQVLRQCLGVQRVASGATTFGATLIGPGEIRLGGEGEVILEDNENITRFADWFLKAGMTVQRVSDIRSVQWGKLVISAGINPITAILRVRNGDLLTCEPARRLMAITALEAASVANAQGIQLPYTDPVSAVETTAKRTAGNYSSMLQDVLRGAPTEIDAICGAVVRAGKDVGVPTPVNHALWLLVKSLTFSGGSYR